jgi:outer membrane protein, multidrug efflux system
VAALAEINRSAEQSAALTRQRYEQGVISLGDSLKAEHQRLIAQANLRSGISALTASYVAVQKSLGLGWSEAENLAPLAPAQKE